MPAAPPSPPSPPPRRGVLAWLARMFRRLLEILRLTEGEARRVEGQLEAGLGQLLHGKPALAPQAVSLPIAPVRVQFYGHGAFMGAAPALLTHPRWRRILEALMPDVAADVAQAVAEGAGPRELIPLFENNPVMAAFGAAEGMARRRDGPGALHRRDLAAFEWDVFVDDDQVRAWERADSDAGRAAAMDTMLETMVIAHASTVDLVQEAAGFSQYADVRGTPKARLGGVEAPAWLDLFARALELARAPDLEAALTSMTAEPRVTEGDACRLHTFAVPRPAAAANAEWERLTGRPFLSLLLEMKSLRPTAALLSDLVAALNRRDVHVAAVASFDPEEVRGASARPQRVAGRELPGPEELRFFHYAGDLQFACFAGDVAPGSRVLFNGATLLAEPAEPGGAYTAREDVVDELGELVGRLGLEVGVYVQEYDCDDAAAALLTELIGRRSEVFALGFAWGGLPDAACVGADGEDRRGLGSQAMLGVVGTARAWKTAGERQGPPSAAARSARAR